MDELDVKLVAVGNNMIYNDRKILPRKYATDYLWQAMIPEMLRATYYSADLTWYCETRPFVLESTYSAFPPAPSRPSNNPSQENQRA